MTGKKLSVKEIVLRKVNETINEFDGLSDELKVKLVEAIRAKTYSNTQQQKVLGALVYDAFLKMYIHQSNFATKKVKLKSGDVVEKYQATTLMTSRLQNKIRKAKTTMNEKIVAIMLSSKTQKVKLSEVQELQDKFDILQSTEIEKLREHFTKESKKLDNIKDAIKDKQVSWPESPKDEAKEAKPKVVKTKEAKSKVVKTKVAKKN